MTPTLHRALRAPLLLVALAPGLGACGSEVEGGAGGGDPGGTAAVEPFTAGSRLRPMLLDAGDGATTFLSFFDQELGLRCWFQPTIDGELRCLPRSGDAWYLDEACTTPAVPAGCLGPEGATLAGNGAEECDDRMAAAVFVPTSTDATEGERIVGFGTECGPQGDLASMVTAERLPLDGFVRGEVEDVALDAGLGARRIVAEDGATVVTDLLRDGSRCMPVELAGELRCLDVLRAVFDQHAQLFAGAGCTGDEVVLTGADCDGEEPSIATRGGQPECGGTMFALGDEVARAHAEQDGTCTEVEYDGGGRKVGGPIAPEDLPAMTEVERGTGRVVVRDRLLAGVTAPGGERPMAELFDTDLGVACRPAVDAEGTVRCFPSGHGLAMYVYADPACTEPLFHGDDTGCSGAPDARFATRVAETSCPYTLGYGTYSGVVSDVLERGAPYEGPVYALNDATFDCSGGDPAPGYHAVGAVHPPEAFAVLELR